MGNHLLLERARGARSRAWGERRCFEPRRPQVEGLCPHPENQLPPPPRSPRCFLRMPVLGGVAGCDRDRPSECRELPGGRARGTEGAGWAQVVRARPAGGSGILGRGLSFDSWRASGVPSPQSRGGTVRVPPQCPDALPRKLRVPWHWRLIPMEQP